MKKLFVLVLLFSSLGLTAQFNSGSFYFTGATDLNFGLEVDEGYSSVLAGFHPEGGYFIMNRLGIGGGIHTDSSLPVGEYAEFTDATFEVYLGPNVRYYLPREDDWQVYGYGFLFYGFTQEPGGFDASNHQLYGFTVGPGVNYFLSERVAFDARLTYMFKHQWNPEMGGSHNIHRFFFEMGISVFFPSITFFFF